MRILLPIDVTHPHPEFLPLLNELTPLKDAQVRLLYVKEELPAAEHMLRTLAVSHEELDQKVTGHAKEVLDSIQASVKNYGAGTSVEIVGGPAAMMIEQVARDEKFDMIAITPGSSDSIDKFLLGRVSAKVVRHAPCTVILLRGEVADHIDSIVVGIDGSEHATQSLRSAINAFSLKEKGSKIYLVNVVTVNPIFTMMSPITFISAVEGNLRMSGETLLAEAETVCKHAGIDNIEMVLREGNTVTELIHVAQEKSANLIVVGSQGKNAVEHFLMGSTSTRLANHAPCPVAIFKHDKAR